MEKHTRTSRKKLSVMLVAALLVTQLIGCFGGKQKVVWCDDLIDPQSPVVSNGFGFDLANSRNNSSEINSQNVAQLKLSYTLSQPKQDERRGAPVVTEQAIFFHEQHAIVAVNRDSGCRYWATEVNPTIRSASTVLYNDPVLNKRVVAVGTFGAEVIAFDAVTGELIWSQDVSEFNVNTVTGGLQYYDGKLFVPLSSLEVGLAIVQNICCKTHGSLVAIDSSNGRELWRFHTTEPAAPAGEFWGPNGVSVWSSPLIDTHRNQVLIGTSQNFTAPASKYADSIVALDIATGKVNWSYQLTPVDFYNLTCEIIRPLFPNCPDQIHALDWDVITPLLTQNDAGDDMIIGADKGGNVVALDPQTGAKLWHSRIGAGTSLGGIHWGMAVDDHSVYFGVSDLKAPQTSLIRYILGLTKILTLDLNAVVAEGGTPGVFALNKNTGELRWSFHDEHNYEGSDYPSIFSAAVSVSNDLVFAGSLDGRLTALDTTTGTPLWRYDASVDLIDAYGRKGKGGTIDSVGPVVAGRQLLLNSGYSNFGGSDEYQGGPGNSLFVFRLDESVQP